MFRSNFPSLKRHLSGNAIWWHWLQYCIIASLYRWQSAIAASRLQIEEPFCHSIMGRNYFDWTLRVQNAQFWWQFFIKFKREILRKADANADEDENGDEDENAAPSCQLARPGATCAMCVTYFKPNWTEQKPCKSSCRLSAAQYKTICWRCANAMLLLLLLLLRLLSARPSACQSVYKIHIEQLHIKCSSQYSLLARLILTMPERELSSQRKIERERARREEREGARVRAAAAASWQFNVTSTLTADK